MKHVSKQWMGRSLEHTVHFSLKFPLPCCFHLDRGLMGFRDQRAQIRVSVFRRFVHGLKVTSKKRLVLIILIIVFKHDIKIIKYMLV